MPTALEHLPAARRSWLVPLLITVVLAAVASAPLWHFGQCRLRQEL
jgi:hypothetical protein